MVLLLQARTMEGLTIRAPLGLTPEREWAASRRGYLSWDLERKSARLVSKVEGRCRAWRRNRTWGYELESEGWTEEHSNELEGRRKAPGEST